jgi:arylsulfatase A-like enzyme
MAVAGSGQDTKSTAGGWMTSLRAFFQREFQRPGPSPLGDLIILPLAVAAIAGLITGVWVAAYSHFLDPASIGYSIVINACVQIAILLIVLLLAFVTRRKAWSGALLAIGLFSFLVIPQVIKLLLPGSDYRVRLCIAVVGAFQIVRTVNRHLHRRFALWMIGVPAIVAVCALSFGAVREHRMLSALPKAPSSPNVIVIIVDTLRADHLSNYGYDRDTSPYLTQLAQQGVVFDNALAPSSWTLPSHASMLTGLSPRLTRMEAVTDILPGRFPTLGEAMSQRGYRTAAISANYKFFTPDHGFIRGFSRFENYELTTCGILDDVYISRVILDALSHFTTGVNYAFFGVKNWASAEKVNKHALNWIANDTRPYFLVLNYTDVHEPTLPPEPYLNAYTKSPAARNESMRFQDDCVDAEFKPSCIQNRQQFIDTYDGSIRYVDQSIQQLMAELKQRGQLENTIVVFTSDHGQEFGDHSVFGHAKSLYRGEIQVPLFFWKPGLIPPSVRITTPVSTSDLSATILDLTAPGDKQPLPGHPLAALWASSQSAGAWPEPISELTKFHSFDKRAPNYNSSLLSVVTPEWHYILRGGKKEMLFDWKADPAEEHDLSAAQPAVCAALRATIQSAEGSWFQAH